MDSMCSIFRTDTLFINQVRDWCTECFTSVELLVQCFSSVLKIEQHFFTCSEWVVNQHRDSLASYIGHHNLMEFFAVAENESKARVKFNFLQVRNNTVEPFYSGHHWRPYIQIRESEVLL